MKFAEILRFELFYQARRVSTWLSFAILFAFALFMAMGSAPTDADELVNSPFAIAFFTVAGGAIWILISASIAGEAAARDLQTRMYPLTFTAPVSKLEYLGGRLLAAFALNASILLAVPAGMLLGVQLADFPPSHIGPLRPASYLTAYGVIALPLGLVATVIQFGAALLSRRSTSSYLASVLLLILSTFGLLVLSRLLGGPELVRLLDLVGLGGIINILGDSWTATEKNARLVGLDGTLILNRLIWLALAGAICGLVYRAFSFSHPGEAARRGVRGWPLASLGTPAHRSLSEATHLETLRDSRISVPDVRRAFGPATAIRQTVAIASTAFRVTAKSPGGLILLTAIAALLVVFLPQNIELFGIPLLPSTALVLTFLTAPISDPFSPWVIVPLLVIFYSAELVWREREAGLGDIVDAAPVREWVLFLGKFLGLGLVLFTWMALLTAAGMLVQVSMGYPDLELGLYLRALFGMRLTEYLLFALLALVVQVVAHQKHVGLLAALCTYGYIAFAPKIGIEHPLLVYGSTVGWSYTDMRGFGGSVEPWIWLTLYWTAWALLLALVASLLMTRGREGKIAERLRLARRRVTRGVLGVFVGATGLILTLGGFVFYNTNVLNEYAGTSDRLQWSAAYERRYGQYEGIPQPHVSGTTLHVEIYSDRRAVEVRGTYRLVNGGASPIESIHVATARGGETAVSFDRPATHVLADEAFGHHVYTLARPLAPGDSVRLEFELEVQHRGFGIAGVDSPVVPNGTFFMSEKWLPAVGYQRNREVEGASDRLAQGLPAPPFFRSLDEAEPLENRVGEDGTTFEVVVGTDTDQTAIAPGMLRATWIEGERRYFRYSTDAPIRGEYAFFSADYAVEKASWSPSAATTRASLAASASPVDIRIYYHPEHSANLDRMVRSVRASLDHYTRQFGPYPYGHITLVEIPGIGGMHAYGSLITFQEGFSLFDLRNASGLPDFPFAVVAHEVAHQWWGSHLGPFRMEGSPLLSESLAEYSAFQVVRNTYGERHLRSYVARLRAHYASSSNRASVPLLRATDEFHQYYKGPLALYAVGEYIGHDQVQRALRRVLETYRSGTLVTTLDLYRELQAVTPDSLHSLLHDLFAANTFWDFETTAATAEQTSSGAWNVTLDVTGQKTVVDTAGVRTAMALDDWVEIGVFAEPAAGQDEGRPLYLRRHRIRPGSRRISVAVPGRPDRVVIDPRNLLFDEDRENNSFEVRIPGSDRTSQQ